MRENPLYVDIPSSQVCPWCKATLRLRHRKMNSSKKYPGKRFQLRPFAAICPECTYMMVTTKRNTTHIKPTEPWPTDGAPKK